MKTAIVAEGGGQRGIYTAGVLDAFLAARFDPFDEGIGVSAGAQNLLTYFLEQPGYARRAIAELTAAPDFFVPYRWFGARGMLDLDGYFERTLRDPDYLLPYQRFEELRGQRRLVFVATDRESLEPVYLEPDAGSAMAWMKASSAVPFLYRSGVPFGDRCLVDGGVADPLPVRYAYARGARRILVVRTVGEAGGGGADWRQPFARMGRAGALPVAMRRMLECHEAACRDAEAFMSTPPDDLELVQLRPRSPLESQLFGSRSESLVADHRAGLVDGERTRVELARWAVDRAKGCPSEARERTAGRRDPVSGGAVAATIV